MVEALKQLGQSSRVVGGAAAKAEDSVMEAVALASCTDLLEGCAQTEPLQDCKARITVP